MAGAIEELVDNSIGHGRADAISVLIDNKDGIAIRDNGIGVDDVNRIFQIGNASSYSDLSQIGQYGVGATNATIYLGDTVTVETVRDGKYHKYSVDWQTVERSQQWPLEYVGDGRSARIDQVGTNVTVTNLARHYMLATSEKMARDFGIVFAPALRRGTKILLFHTLANGTKQGLVVEPFTPQDLTNIITISGQIETKHGTLRWAGRAGLSATLVERHNGIHIAFGHRVIETTCDPFRGKSAPTLYGEIQLDETTPWKHQLSEHKDKVVRYRDELMDSIYKSIEALIDKSSRQAQNLALNLMIAPIESALNKALKAAGNLFIDPNEDPMAGGEHGDGPEPVKPGKRLFTPQIEGDPAKEIKRPTGISFEFQEPEQLEGRGYGWKFSGSLMTILLDKTEFIPALTWPPKTRNDSTTKSVVFAASHAIELEYIANEENLKGVISSKLINQISTWLGERNGIAPRLYKLFMQSIST